MRIIFYETRSRHTSGEYRRVFRNISVRFVRLCLFVLSLKRKKEGNKWNIQWTPKITSRQWDELRFIDLTELAGGGIRRDGGVPNVLFENRPKREYAFKRFTGFHTCFFRVTVSTHSFDTHGEGGGITSINVL